MGFGRRLRRAIKKVARPVVRTVKKAIPKPVRTLSAASFALAAGPLALNRGFLRSKTFKRGAITSALVGVGGVYGQGLAGKAQKLRGYYSKFKSFKGQFSKLRTASQQLRGVSRSSSPSLPRSSTAYMPGQSVTARTRPTRSQVRVVRMTLQQGNRRYVIRPKR